MCRPIVTTSTTYQERRGDEAKSKEVVIIENKWCCHNDKTKKEQ
jgi:hypothetical protein